MNKAGPSVLKIVGLIGGFALIAWMGSIVQDNFTRDDVLFLAIAVPIGLGIVGFGLWATFFIAIAAYYYWPMTIILVLIGGFMGGGWGAVIGAYLSGIIGLVLAKFQESKF